MRDISITSSSFSDCVSSNVSRQFRANAGAVSIAYYREPEGEEDGVDQILSTVTIQDCTFSSNSAFLVEAEANISESDSSRIDQALNTNFFNGRGGGVAIVPQDPHFNVRARITGNTFQQNHADTFGGGLFLLIEGTETSHRFLVDNCTFLGNEASLNFGGGIHVALLLRNLVSEPTRITVTGSTFRDNLAYFGGGFSVVQVRVSTHTHTTWAHVRASTHTT